MKKITFLLFAMVAFTWQANAQNSTCATAAPLTIGGTACAGTSGGANSGDPTGNDDTDGNVCSSSYSGGDDFIFEYTATTTDALKLDLFATNTWTGIMVTEGCPTTGTCFASATSSSINESLTTPAMTIGATYYIHVSTYPSPQSPGQFCIDATLETPATPPANDECADAIGLTVNPDYACGTVTAGTVAGATDSGANDATCYGTPNDDVWYSFTATATDHRVSLTNLVGSTTDMYMTFYDATAGCGSLGASIACSDPQTANLTGLTIGTTYFVQVYSYYADLEDTTFDICVGTPPTCPVPTGLGATNITTMSADLGWTENGTATAWDIEWGTNGFTPTGTPNIEDTTNPHPLGGLSASSSYDFYVRADCGGGDTSTWAGPYTFATADPPPACGGNFYDDGGNAANYSNSANITTTICPDVPGDAVNVTFTFFSTENNGSTGCYDGLTIHDGPDASAPTINPTTGTIWCWDRNDATPNGTGDLQGMTISSTDASGCLTFVFTSDSGVNREGWEATVGCAPLSLEDYGLTGFTYFPNPVNNTLSLRGVKDIQNVAVYNMLGQEVLRTSPNTVTSEVDMSNLQPGAYFVKVTVENATKTIKVIKK